MNPLINPGHAVCQNPSAVSSAAEGTELSDRWVYNKIGLMVHDIAIVDDVPTVAQAGRLLTKSYKLTLTTPQNTLGATDECVVVQKIWGDRFAPIAQQEQKIRGWVKSDLANQYAISLRNDGTSGTPDRSCVLPFTLTTTGWTEIVLDMPATPAAGDWYYDQDRVGLRFGIVLAAGSYYQASNANQWVNQYAHCASGQVNGVQTGAGSFWFTDFEIYPGAGSPQEARSRDDEYRLCRRYRQRLTGPHAGSKVFKGVVVSPTMAQFFVAGDMRTVSEIKFGGTPAIWDGATVQPVTSITKDAAAEGMVSFTAHCESSALTTGNVAMLRMSASTDFVELFAA